jgi:hypothetical protein
VVVPTAADRAVTEAALRAVLDDPATAEVIVVVAAADPGAAEAGDGMARLRRWAVAEPRLRLLSVEEGASGMWRVQRARDAGVEAARSEVVLSLDDDVVLDPGVVSGHAAAHHEADDLVVLGYMPVATRQRWPRGKATIRFYSETYELHCRHYEEDPREILTALWGGDFSVRRDRWLAAVRRPRTSAWGHDDQEMGLLFLREGMRGRFDRALSGRHHYERSLAGFIARAEKSAIGQAELRAANPDLLPERSLTRGRRDLVAGPVLAAARVPFVWTAVRAGLIGAMALAGALRLDSLGDTIAGQVWFLAQERALREAA